MLKFLNKFLLLIAVLPLLVLYSCTSSASINENDYTIGGVKESINKNSKRLNALKGEGVISIDSPEMSNSGSFSLSIVKPDSLFIKLEGPFGISVAAILLARENFIYYNIQENRVIKGPSSPVNLKAIMRVKLDFEDYIDGFSGSYSFPDTSSENFSLSKDENNLILIENGITETKKYYMHPMKMYIEKYKVDDKTGKEVMLVEYLNFTEEKGFFFPNKIKISRAQNKEFVFIDYSSKELNKGHLNPKIKYPKSAKVVEW